MLISAAMVVSILLADRIWGVNLANRTAPSGLLTLELSNDPFVTKAIVNSWDQSEQLYAAYRIGLGLVLWMFVVTGMTSALLWAAGEMRFVGPTMVRVGRMLAWQQIIAGIFHVAGTVTLIEILIDAADATSFVSLDRQVTVAWACSVVKYSILATGTLYIAAVPLARSVRPRENTQQVRQSKGFLISR